MTDTTLEGTALDSAATSAVDEQRAYVVVATKGRPADVSVLLEMLRRQSLRPELIVVVGTDLSDFGDASSRYEDEPSIVFRVSSTAGSTFQRNVGVDVVIAHHDATHAAADFFIAYFDDDFRPADDWLQRAASVLAEPDVVGVTGQVLADGKRGHVISESAAADYIAGRRPAEADQTDHGLDQPVISAYGCNMAFRGDVSRACRFDERLPAYAWQEDRDYTGQVLRLGLGSVRSVSACRGVHLAEARGRVSGLRFGYSQIANPIHIARKGTTPWSAMLHLMTANVAANHLRSVRSSAEIDWRGRARGNWLAIRDLLIGRLAPERIDELTVE